MEMDIFYLMEMKAVEVVTVEFLPSDDAVFNLSLVLNVEKPREPVQIRIKWPCIDFTKNRDDPRCSHLGYFLSLHSTHSLLV